MTAIKKEKYRDSLRLVYDYSDRPNNTQLEPLKDRAKLTYLTADLLLPNNSIMQVEMDFDLGSGYHDNGLIVMGEYGARLLADAMAYRHGEQAKLDVLDQWQRKANQNDPRKPTFLFAKPSPATGDCTIFAACGSTSHSPHDPDGDEGADQ